MNRSTVIAILLVLFVALATVIYVYTQSNAERISTKNDNSLIEKVDESTNDNNATDEKMPEKVTNTTAGKYIAYNSAALTDGKNVIFFAASWCPSCRVLDNAINSEQKAIPENLTILKANYDSEVTLKQKYGVTYQHTLVQVDKEGNLIKKWSGGSTLTSILVEVQ
jgi:thiol-disulfide isomerase/thioredoxin